MFLLNALKTPDIVFFVMLGVVVLVCVAIYFLIPIIKKKEFEERRENLKKREAVFRANLKAIQSENITVENKQPAKDSKKEEKVEASNVANQDTVENENKTNEEQ